MKRIIIIRHAKSSWKHNLKDHERPLKARGKRDAELIAKHTSKRFEIPDVILSSTANRTRLTANYFIKNWNIDPSAIEYREELYDFSGEDLLKIIRESNDQVNSLMIFGHNFAITDFVNTFGNQYIDNVPTTGFIVLEFAIDSWHNLKQGEIVYKVFPKEIRND